MQVSDVKATLLKLASRNRRFSKIKATLPTNAGSGISGPERENPSEDYQAFETTAGYRLAQLEAHSRRQHCKNIPQNGLTSIILDTWLLGRFSRGACRKSASTLA